MIVLSNTLLGSSLRPALCSVYKLLIMNKYIFIWRLQTTSKSLFLVHGLSLSQKFHSLIRSVLSDFRFNYREHDFAVLNHSGTVLSFQKWQNSGTLEPDIISEMENYSSIWCSDWSQETVSSWYQEWLIGKWLKILCHLWGIRIWQNKMMAALSEEHRSSWNMLKIYVISL